MHTELDILRDVGARLEQLRIEYMLTGSFAMNYYTIPRMTRDMDLVVDCIVRKNSVYRAHEFTRRQRIVYHTVDVWIVSREDLILSKLLWARQSSSALQLDDVRHLLDGVGDMAYLQHWAPELGLQAQLEICNACP